jgi:hypothetical protein
VDTSSKEYSERKQIIRSIERGGYDSNTSCFHVVEHRGYFGPRGQAPPKGRPQPLALKKTKDGHSKYNTIASKHVSASNEPLSNAIPVQHQKWFDFDPHMDVHIGDFVEVQAPKTTQKNGELFWVAKVRELENVAREDGKFLALWYWPTKPKGLRNGSNAIRTRYVNSLATTTSSYNYLHILTIIYIFFTWDHFLA